MVNKGTVSVSLEDFREAEKTQERLKYQIVKHSAAAKELGVFLHFLQKNVPDMDRHIEQFNKQSEVCKIIEIDGRIKVVMKNETTENN